MIIMILIIAAFAISATIVALVLLDVIDAYTDEPPFTATAVVCGLSTAALLICGITCIVHSQPSSIATCEYALAEKIELCFLDKCFKYWWGYPCDVSVYRFKDYGKTWALTREEL